MPSPLLPFPQYSADETCPVTLNRLMEALVDEDLQFYEDPTNPNHVYIPFQTLTFSLSLAGRLNQWLTMFTRFRVPLPRVYSAAVSRAVNDFNLRSQAVTISWTGVDNDYLALNARAAKGISGEMSDAQLRGFIRSIIMETHEFLEASKNDFPELTCLPQDLCSSFARPTRKPGPLYWSHVTGALRTLKVGTVFEDNGEDHIHLVLDNCGVFIDYSPVEELLTCELWESPRFPVHHRGELEAFVNEFNAASHTMGLTGLILFGDEENFALYHQHRLSVADGITPLQVSEFLAGAFHHLRRAHEAAAPELAALSSRLAAPDDSSQPDGDFLPDDEWEEDDSWEEEGQYFDPGQDTLPGLEDFTHEEGSDS